jgi:hypothetical protein
MLHAIHHVTELGSFFVLVGQGGRHHVQGGLRGGLCGEADDGGRGIRNGGEHLEGGAIHHVDRDLVVGGVVRSEVIRHGARRRIEHRQGVELRALRDAVDFIDHLLELVVDDAALRGVV